MRSPYATDIDRFRATRGDATTSAMARSTARSSTAGTTTTTGIGTRHGAGCDSETV